MNQDLLERLVKVHGKDSFLTGGLRNALGEEYTKRNQHDKALAQFQALEGVYSKLFGPDSENVLIARNRVALTYQALGQLDKALPLFDETVAKFREQKGRSAPGNLLVALDNAAACYEVAKKLPEAEKLRRELVETQRKVAGPEAPGTTGALAGLGLNLLNQEKWGDAEAILRECLEIRQKKTPDDWRTANARSLLGGALLGQKKYVDAEPLLKEGYEGLHKHAAEIPPQGKARLTEALERLVQLCEATDRKDEAAALRKKLEETEKAKP